MKVLVVTGGGADEREISFISASNVAIGLLRKGHTVEMFDFINNFSALKEKLKNINVVFPVLHGKEGEGGTLQEFLEKQKIKFVGSGSQACYNGWNKLGFKDFCKKNKILTPSWFKLPKKKVNSLNTSSLPFVIKPTDSGSSRGIYIIKNKSDLEKVPFKKLLRQYELYVERYIDGVEVTVGILGNKVLPVVEIQPPQGEWFDYENKYSGRTKELAPAPSIKPAQKTKLKKITWEIHSGIGCNHYSRTDYIVSKDEIYALEINTIPGLTPESLLPKAAKAAGISFEEMVDQLVKMATKE